MAVLEHPTPLLDIEAPHLPQEIWAGVFSHLAATLEPHDGLRGPGVVAADIIRAGLTCREMYRGARAGLGSLAKAVPVSVGTWPLPPGEPTGAVDWARWDRLLSDPWVCKASDLQDALHALALPVPQAATQTGLAARLLAAFGLTQGCPVPVRLWVALQQERMYLGPSRIALVAVVALRDMVEAGDEAAKHALEQPNLADARRALCDAYGSTTGLMAAHRRSVLRLVEVRRQRRREELAARREAAARGAAADQAGAGQGARLGDELQQGLGLINEGACPPSAVEEGLSARRAMHAVYGHAACVCSSPAARQCSLVLCGRCCAAYRSRACPRHGD